MRNFDGEKDIDIVKVIEHELFRANLPQAVAYLARQPISLAKQDRIEGGEMRWQTIAMVVGSTLVLVAHTATFDDDIEVIRIISARRADRQERKRHEQQAHQGTK